MGAIVRNDSASNGFNVILNNGQFNNINLTTAVASGSDITISYANGSGQSKQATLYVNGLSTKLYFNSTGAWWNYISYTINLKQWYGVNKLTNINSVKIQVDNDDLQLNGTYNYSGEVNLDYIDIQTNNVLLNLYRIN
ncbi:carbohydrate-binding protein [Paenibacillus pini]|uniref:hypothetical protein n=1 Tax=Paenibacillus pini TaxID=669461 RepID=UPI000560264C|nr:hypothetical protein [Paenibacillus pini]